ncbi:MAG: hypothetical protein H7138_20925 [Myxococcales bacterium]|nr:hypothetical protein [Myxococcales bacterium]
MRDHQVFEGTALQIMRQMQDLAFGAPEPLADYLAWVASNARKMDGVELAIHGDTDDELAAFFVAEMARCKLARIETR